MSHRAISLLGRQGQSIVQALVALAVTGIVGMATIALIQNQHKETAAVAERLAKMEVTSQLVSLLSDPVSCAYMVSNFSSGVFNGASISQESPQLKISKILAAPQVNAPVVVQTDHPISAITNRVISDNIYIRVSSGAADRYYGVLGVSFDDTKLTRSIKDIEIPLAIQVNPASPVSAREITGCVLGSVPGGGDNEMSAKAYFSWNGSSSSGKNVKVSANSGRLSVAFEAPMTNNRYTVICNGAMTLPGTGHEMQLIAINKTRGSFVVTGSHASGSDPIGIADCVVFGQ